MSIIGNFIKTVRNRYFPLTKIEERAQIRKFEKNKEATKNKYIREYFWVNHGITSKNKEEMRSLIEEIVSRVNSGHLYTFDKIEEYFSEINRRYTKEEVVQVLEILAKSDVLDCHCRLTSGYDFEYKRDCEVKIVEYFAKKLKKSCVDVEFEDVRSVLF
jgi:hypothetical protein